FMKKTERRLAAIVFTDIVGYSAMMQKDEVLTTRLRNRHREAFKKFTNTHGGQVIQYFGDGTLSIYPSAAAAVEFAVALQKSLKSADPPVPMRIGIHTGDITFGEEDAFGDGVNVASRIESMCIPGGVFISGKVYDDIKNHSRLRATKLGRFRLKNIQDPMDIFAINNRGITVPEYKPRARQPKSDKDPVVVGGRKKWLAGVLGITLGLFGVHRFYLGKRFAGFLFLLAFLLGVLV
ncbi:MAG: adenylate/guanylate cyclase domain-containing protein, partial [Bacteroidota bacterium]